MTALLVVGALDHLNMRLGMGARKERRQDIRATGLQAETGARVCTIDVFDTSYRLGRLSFFFQSNLASGTCPFKRVLRQSKALHLYRCSRIGLGQLSSSGVQKEVMESFRVQSTWIPLSPCKQLVGPRPV
jgi:hypothetical protein